MSRDFSTVEPGTIASSSLRATATAAERRQEFGDERILAIVREGEAGQRVADLCETHGISAQMYYLWKARYGGMDLAELRRLRRRSAILRGGLAVSAAVVIFGVGLGVGRALTGSTTTAPMGAVVAAQAARPSVPALQTLGVPVSEPNPRGESATIPPPLEGPDPDQVATVTATGGEEGPPVARVDPPLPDLRAIAAAVSESAVASEKREPRRLAVKVPASAAHPSEAPSDSGYSVQVAAVPEVGEADALIGRLAAKGYTAFVVSKAGPAPLHRVRVGPFKSLDEARATAERLSTEEQFKPWITK